MSHPYQAIGWNRQKRVYDLLLLAGIASYLTIFIALGNLLFPFATAETLIIRAAGSAAFLLLHIVLCIGPLCRLDSRFLPLLYNRRHLGVATFLLGAVHGVFGIIQFHSLGDKNPLVSLLTSNRNFTSLVRSADRPCHAGNFAVGNEPVSGCRNGHWTGHHRRASHCRRKPREEVGFDASPIGRAWIRRRLRS